MRCVIQVVREASVTVEGKTAGAIEKGLLVYFGVGKSDTEETVRWICDKILKERFFHDQEGKTNLCLSDVGGQILVVSQFTLYASLKKGNRPGYDDCGDPAAAEKLYEKALDYLASKGVAVAHGTFGAHMLVSYTNIGPATFLLEK